MFLLSHVWEYILLITTVILAFTALKRSSPFPYHVLAWMTLATLPVETFSIVLAYRYHNNLCYGMWKYMLQWPMSYYVCTMLVANAVFYVGTMITFIRLRKINRWEVVI